MQSVARAPVGGMGTRSISQSASPFRRGNDVSPGTDEERVVATLIGAGRTLNAWRGPIVAVERELDVSAAEARVLVEELQHRGVVRVKGEKTTGLPLLYWWVRCSAGPPAKGE